MLKPNGEDDMIIDTVAATSGQFEKNVKHVQALYWLWNEGIQDRTGNPLVRFRVQRLSTQMFPALA